MNLYYYTLAYFLSDIIFSASAQIHRDQSSRVFDQDLYKRVIDDVECDKQMFYLQTRNLLLYINFLDAGARFPRGIPMFNLADLGHYHQCLGINAKHEDMKFQGKYCLINVPLLQTKLFPFLDPNNTIFDTNKKIIQFNNDIISNVQRFGAPALSDSITSGDPLLLSHINLGLCMPESCSTQKWVEKVAFNVSAVDVLYDEQFCRLPNDKPWVGADYVAVGVFSLLGFITLLSTLYDVNHIIIQKKDPKQAVTLLRTFSVYTNTKRLLTFSPNVNALECMDGIRSISMMWVIVGHAFSMHSFYANFTDAVTWLTSGDAVWVSTGLFTVDTFFLMSGILLVYTSVGKLSGVDLLKRLHIFYLNRLLRMFPLLAALVLLEASAFHRVADGPYWELVGRNVERCRSNWWTTLLHVQNFVNPNDMCVAHSWYVALDIQMHLVAPLVLFFVLNKSKLKAWAALLAALLSILTGATIWNFKKAMPSSNMFIPRLDEQTYYMNNFYTNTLCRAAPFLVGMITGYILNMYKGIKLKLNLIFVLGAWILSLSMIAFCFYASYVTMQIDWDNQVGDSLFNSFIRTIWVTGLSWIIFASVKGYGGPINWFLSLNVWKLPARISFAIYLYHYAICFVIAGMEITPTYFSQGARIYDSIAIFCITFAVAFLVTVVIDAPFSVLIKMLMEGAQRKSPKPVIGNGTSKPGPVEKQADLEITTLDKSRTFDNIHHLEKNVTIEKNLQRQLLNLEVSAVRLERQLSNENNGQPIDNETSYLNKKNEYSEKNDASLNNGLRKIGDPKDHVGN